MHTLIASFPTVVGVNPLVSTVSLRITPFAPEATCTEPDRFVFLERVGKLGALESIGLSPRAQVSCQIKCQIVGSTTKMMMPASREISE